MACLGSMPVTKIGLIVNSGNGKDVYCAMQIPAIINSGLKQQSLKGSVGSRQ
jgi:hypothetical protein